MFCTGLVTYVNVQSKPHLNEWKFQPGIIPEECTVQKVHMKRVHTKTKINMVIQDNSRAVQRAQILYWIIHLSESSRTTSLIREFHIMI